VSDPEITVPTIVELKELLDDLDSEADNYGRDSHVGVLCLRAEAALYGLARSCLDAPR
jgi:hypothetical protein